MKHNMGTSDRSIRSFIALIIIALNYYEIITGTLGIILIVASIIFLLTNLVGFCPLYAPFGISSCRPEGERV